MKTPLSYKIRRRDFLLYGAGGALGAMTVGLRPLEALAGDTLSVGYLDQLTGRFVPAERLLSGDGRLLREGAQVTVHGAKEAGDIMNRFEELSLFTHYRVPRDGVIEDIPVLSWNFRKEQVPSVASSVSFMAPVDSREGLRITLEHREKKLGPVVRSEVRFTAGAEKGRPKLRPGTYHLAVPPTSGHLIISIT